MLEHMSTPFAINGFGRIGRLVFRAWVRYHKEEIELSAINTSGSMDLAGWAHLAKYDTAYGPFPGQLTFEEHQPAKAATDEDPFLGNLILDTSYKIPVLAQRNPEKIPWHQYGAGIIVESTGHFRTKKDAALHLQGGARQVVISAPAKDQDILTSVRGVNAKEVLAKNHAGTIAVLNNASCTTNCVAPVAAIMVERLGVAKAALTTIHSYTDDQNLQDGSHSDLRRARAGAANIVPTSTGAAEAAAAVVPELKGIFDGLALRVPTISGSLTDFTFLVKTPTSVEVVNTILSEESKKPRWQGILAVTDEPLVSSDIVGRRESSIVDLSLTQVIGGDLVKIFAWYDNEWGYSNRLLETVIDLAKA